MFKFILLFAVALTASADYDEDMEQCVTILNSHCCNIPIHKNMDNKTRIMDTEVKECMLIPYIPGSCDRGICIGTKKGFGNADGTIKMEKFQKHIEEKFSDLKDVLEVLKEECLSGGYTSYAEPDDCDMNKMEYCIRWQAIFRCPDFNDEGPCKGSKDFAETCLKLYS